MTALQPRKYNPHSVPGPPAHILFLIFNSTKGIFKDADFMRLKNFETVSLFRRLLFNYLGKVSSGPQATEGARKLLEPAAAYYQEQEQPSDRLL
jgi:hypothetical protein